MAVAEVPGLDSEEWKMVQAFAAQQPRTVEGDAQTALIPEEWEQPLFDILLDEKQTMDQRNARLIELATGRAKDVPSVQEECVIHLLFGLPDDSGTKFLVVTTNPAIPLRMRTEFLKQALDMRPPELGEWLSRQVSNHYEPEISSIARLYLLDLRNSGRQDF